MHYSITAMMRWIDMTMTPQICTDGVYFYAWLCIARCFSMQQLDYPERRICFGCDDSCYTAWLCIASGLQWQLLVIA